VSVHDDDGFAGVRGFSREHLVHDAAQGIEVGLGCYEAVVELFWGHVGDGAEELACLCQSGVGGAEHCGYAEVEEFYGACVGDHDVGWFHVSVDHRVGVQAVQYSCCLLGDEEGLFYGEAPLFVQDFAEVSAQHQFPDHIEVFPASLQLCIVEYGHVGVGEPGAEFGFAAEAGHHVFGCDPVSGGGEPFGADDFDGNGSFESGVPSLPDLPHAALPQQGAQFVAVVDGFHVRRRRPALHGE
jgi:hypothetical protein